MPKIRGNTSCSQSYPHYPHFLGKFRGDKKTEKETNVLCLISKMGLFLLETAKNMDCKNKENNAFLSENKQEFTFPLFRTGYFTYNRKRQ